VSTKGSSRANGTTSAFPSPRSEEPNNQHRAGTTQKLLVPAAALGLPVASLLWRRGGRNIYSATATFFVIGLLRSPLHRLASGSLLLITSRGRSSGRRFTIPVMYAEREGTLTIYVGLSGFTVLVSVLAFGALFGLIGAVIGVPIAAGLQIVAEKLTAGRRACIAAADAAEQQQSA
jgi:hypothetical protein